MKYNGSYGDGYTSYSNGESNTSYEEIPLVQHTTHMIIIYSIAYGLIFIFGVIGNGLVIAVMYKDPRMRNVTNYFILNMAIADILVAFLIVPITLLANLFSGK